MHTHPILCPCRGCSTRFMTAKDALQHAEDPNHSVRPLFLCPLSICQSAVAGRRFPKCEMDRHRAMHVRLGHIGINDEYVPKQAKPLPFSSGLSLFSLIIQSNGLEILNKESLVARPDDNGDSDVEDADFDDADPDDANFEHASNANERDEEEQDEGTPEFQEELELGSSGTKAFSKEHRLQILKQNTAKWSGEKHHKVRLTTLGFTCVGPTSSSSCLTFERCPEEVTIDLDTARLFLKEKQGVIRLRLNCRCVICHFNYRVTQFLRKAGLEFQAKNTICTFEDCDRASFNRSGRCPQHLFNSLRKAHQKKTTLDLRLLQQKFNSAAQKTWSFPPRYNTVCHRMEEICQEQRPGSDLVIMDTEFSPTSTQLWELAIIERVSGKTLINTTIEHKDGLNHNMNGEFPFMTWMSRSKAAAVYSSSRISGISRFNVHEVASKLQQAGITPDTIFLVWHTSRADLSILRQFLESAGYFNILPSDENCIPFIHLLRTNLSEGSSRLNRFPLTLEVLFPTIYPRHSLIGLNHQALVDCQQTRLVCIAFDELCRPVEERGKEWQPDAMERSAQTSIFNWMRDSYTVNNSKDTGTNGRISAQVSQSAKSRLLQTSLDFLQEASIVNNGKDIGKRKRTSNDVEGAQSKRVLRSRK